MLSHLSHNLACKTSYSLLGDRVTFEHNEKKIYLVVDTSQLSSIPPLWKERYGSCQLVSNIKYRRQAQLFRRRKEFVQKGLFLRTSISFEYHQMSEH